ncbi:MAG TPA: tail fiber domain-containing protein [Chitinophagaceae bacterium]
MKLTLQHNIAVVLLSMAGLTAQAQTSWLIAGNSNIGATHFLGTKNNKPVMIRTNNVERIRILANGNVGIGTTTPSYKLHVVGGSYGIYGSGSSYGVVGAGGTYGVYGSGTSYGVYGYSSSNYGVYGNSGYLGVYGSGTSYGVYGYSSANYGVYGYSSSGYGVDGQSYSSYGGYFSSTNSYGLRAATTNGYYAGVFDGNVWTSGSYITSDQKMKKNIREVSNAMDIINQLKPKNYEYLTDGKYTSLNLPKGIHYGLIAQDLEQVLPNLVREAPRELRISAPGEVIKPLADDGKASASIADAQVLQAPAKGKVTTETINLKAVNYEELIPIMIKAMQEQQATIQKQQKQIDDLRSMITTSSVSSGTPDQLVTKTTGFSSGAYIKQNAPNPFLQSTAIQYYVPSSAKHAQLIVYSIDGRQLKSFSLNNGMNQVTIDGGTLSSGQYVYSLVVDGKKVDSKQMVLTK